MTDSFVNEITLYLRSRNNPYINLRDWDVHTKEYLKEKIKTILEG